MNLENISLSITEPITLLEAKEHLRVEHSDDDTYISALITAAREQAESYCELIIPAQQFKYDLDCFPASISLPNAPVISVDSVSYIDTLGTSQTLNEYYLAKTPVSANIETAYSKSFPETQSGRDKVSITFTAGFVDIPETIKHAMKLIIGSLYEQREDHAAGITINSVPWSSKALLNTHKRVLV
jgi:uncharacterized phiE125 gp8 family phage protein